MIVAGIGCRRGCPAADILALVGGTGAEMLAAPAWKRDEVGLLDAARMLELPLRFVDGAALASVQALCPTQSAAAARAVGLASVAEAAALAGGGVLLQARFGRGWATCALASEVALHASPRCENSRATAVHRGDHGRVRPHTPARSLKGSGWGQA